MLPAGSYVTSLGGSGGVLYATIHDVTIVESVSNLKALCVQHGERRTYFLKNKLSISINAEQTHNASNYVERFKVNTVLMVMCKM
jgi:hypothetical protein